MQIKDIMTKKVIFVSPDTSVSEAAELMEKHKIHGLPVIDNKRVVGIIIVAYKKYKKYFKINFI